jgi:fructose-specific phosphotransferase system IIC component
MINIEYFISFLIGLAIGFLIGYFVRNLQLATMPQASLFPRITLVTYIALVVSSIWVLAQVLALARGTLVDPSISTTFAGIVTALFGEVVVKNLTKKE